MKSKPRVLLSAFGVHAGGGGVLLKSLVLALNRNLKFSTIDARLKNVEPLFDSKDQVTYVRKSFLARFISLYKIAKSADANDVLFCFNSLPPLFRPSCRVIAYVQAPHFANMHKEARYTLKTRLRILIERLWFNLGINNCDEIWVQTLTMAEAIRSQHPSVKTRIMPFVDDLLAKKLSVLNISQPNVECDSSKYTFFYPADAVGHKNHVCLLRAWALLERHGYTPKLMLTLVEHEILQLSEQAGMKVDSVRSIENLGRLTRDEVLNRMSVSSAMIFPSLAETFGLPMLEAKAIDLPIIASERDFVRDVCTPIETFDPTSPRSIAAAVERFMGVNDSRLSILDTSQFLASILEESS